MKKKSATPDIGRKVLIAGHEDEGFAEVVSYADTERLIDVSYFIGPSHTTNRRVLVDAVRVAPLPPQTRCYYREDHCFRVGRVLVPVTTQQGISYQVAFPNGKVLLLPETSFHVRSYIGSTDPVVTLANLAHETPFLSDRRSEWLTMYARQVESSQGLQGLISSKIELFPHQVEVVRRVLQDPIIRYLLADEVGLGKTIEAGAIVRQLRLDSPLIPIDIFTPDVLVPQWRAELADRFDLRDIRVANHEAIAEFRPTGGVVVIDEAHRILVSSNRDYLAQVTAPECTPHLLLLSATPVLHHELQLFELLSLLDPLSYPVGSFEQFKIRISRRRELGRALLALSRSTRPAYIAKHAQRCAELLPHDEYVRSTADACIALTNGAPTQDSLMQNATNLRIHLAETYRIHKRLLRTRRSSLVATGDILQVRRKEPSIYSGQEELFIELWQTIEEWRIKAAANFAREDGRDLDKWIQMYLDIAHCAALSPASLGTMLSSETGHFSFPGGEEAIEHLKEIGAQIGDVGSRNIVSSFGRQHGDAGQWVIFCGNSMSSNRIALLFEEEWDGHTFLVTDQMDADTISHQLSQFRSSDRAVLVGDTTIEEGLNLQFASGAYFVDLPFDPMRLEQRLGRLDRLGRRKPARCVVALSVEDSSIAFDSAWYKVLTEGFRLLTESIADQQYLIERYIRELGKTVFEGGPFALVAKTPEIAASVDAERENAAEQDILDGVDVGDLRESTTWKSLERGDEEEPEFGDALGSYLEDNLGLKVQVTAAGSGRAGTLMQFGLRRYNDPLIPSTLLASVGSCAGRVTTVTRTLSSREPSVEFLRPGHPLVEDLRGLAGWDERGQAFALWRNVPKFLDPVFVFKLGILSFVDLGPVRDQLEVLRWDAVAAASLLRLLAGWFPPRYYKLYVNSDGLPVDAELSQWCKAPYSRNFDINLGGERSQILIELTGEIAWPQTCREVASETLRRVKANRHFISRRKNARDAAYEYFQTATTRLRLRSRADADGASAVERLISEQSLLSKLVDQSLEASSLRIDWFGVYVLSKEPVCPR